MGTQSQFALQKAVYETLIGDGAFMSSVTGVFDQPPDAQAPPFVILGEMASQEWANCQSSGADVTLRLHVVSRARGQKEAIALMDSVYRLLHRAELTLGSGYTLVMLRVTATELHRNADGITTEGALQLRALIEE